MLAEGFPAMADALAHLRVAERRHSEASPRSGTTSRLTFSCYIASQYRER
jgi:hypothetical protein